MEDSLDWWAPPQQVLRGLGGSDVPLYPLQKVEDMILEALTLYDADRTGKFDYALETAGGSIPHALCSETYTPSASTVQLFGYTVWQYSNSARTVIQVGVGWGCVWSGALACLLTGPPGLPAWCSLVFSPVSAGRSPEIKATSSSR